MRFTNFIYINCIVACTSLLCFSCNNETEKKTEKISNTAVLAQKKIQNIKNRTSVLPSQQKELLSKNKTNPLTEINLKLPEEFIELSEKQINGKFSDQNRPDCVFETKDEASRLSITYSNISLKIGELPEVLDTISRNLNVKEDINEVAGKWMDTINTIPFAILEYYSSFQNLKMSYNILLITSIEGKLVKIIFSCRKEKLIQLEEEIPLILASIELGRNTNT